MINFDFLFYSNPQPMWIYETDTLKIIEVNDAAIARYGYTKDEFLSKTIADIRPPEDRPGLKKTLLKIHGKRSIYPNEFRHLDKNNKIIPVEIISYPLMYNGINARLVHVQNIEAKKEIKEKLKDTEQNLEQILNNTNIGFLRVDRKFKVTYWNKAAETWVLHGIRRSSSKNIWKIFPEAVDSDFYPSLQKAMNERVIVRFTEYFWPIQKWFSVYAYPADEGLIIHFRDITSKKLAEEKLLQRIEQLKEISYLNSHFIRKPIATLLGLSTLIKDSIVNPNEYKAISEYIYNCGLELDEAVNKLNKKVNDEEGLMALSSEMKDFDFNELLVEIKTKTMLQNPQYEIILNNTEEIIFYGNKDRIKIVLDNLIDNAIKFSPGADQIILTTSLVKQNLVVSIQDFGIGMDARLLNKMCLSLAKKEAIRGPGSGLFKASEIVKKYNGSIWVESKEGKGSIFSIRFPLSNFSEFSNFKIMGNPESLVYIDHGLEIENPKNGPILHVNWKGFHNLQSAKRGCLQILYALKKHRCNAILNDNTNVVGTWEEATEWVGKEWFPMVEKAGLKHLAWIYSPSTFSRLSADHAIERAKGAVTIKTFDEKAEGVKWLNEVAQQKE